MKIGRTKCLNFPSIDTGKRSSMLNQLQYGWILEAVVNIAAFPTAGDDPRTAQGHQLLGDIRLALTGCNFQVADAGFT